MPHWETHVWIWLPTDLGTAGWVPMDWKLQIWVHMELGTAALGTHGFGYCRCGYSLIWEQQFGVHIDLSIADLGTQWIWGTADFSTEDLGTTAIDSEGCSDTHTENIVT